MSALNALHARFGEEVAFFVVYIREAHPVGSRRPDRRVRVEEPETLEERAQVAGSCAADLDLRLPVLIDQVDDDVERDYSAWPDRLFLIDVEGRVAYRGGRGPRGFRPEELEAAIEDLLGEAR